MESKVVARMRAGEARDKQVTHVCVACKKTHPRAFRPRCECGGLIDVVYDLGRARVVESDSPLERYFDLLPLETTDDLLWMGEGNTPCVHARQLGRVLGLDQLWLKDETKNPTRTTKDRMASVAMSYLYELGHDEFVMCSTGNSSTAFAAAAQSNLRMMKVHVVCGDAFYHRLNFESHPSSPVYLVDGDFVAAGKAAKALAEREGLLFENGFFNPARREGLKLAYLEAFDQLPRAPQWIFQAVSSGMGIYGAYKGIREFRAMGRLDRTPRIVCAQQTRCAPMVNAWRDGAKAIDARYVVESPSGLAPAILRGDPTGTYPYIRAIVERTRGAFEDATDAEILSARALLEATEGIEACHASAVALAAAIKMRRVGALKKDDLVLVNLTGGARDASVVPRQYTRLPRAGAKAA